jgi:hypothetical protein
MKKILSLRNKRDVHAVRRRPEGGVDGAEACAEAHTAAPGAAVPGDETPVFVSRWGASRNRSVNVLLSVCEGICQACEAREAEDDEQEQAHQEGDDAPA